MTIADHLDKATCARFERPFHSRTLTYLPGFRDDGRPVVVVLGPDAGCAAGHAIAVCLINQIARAHRRIVVVGDPDASLECRSPFGHQTIGEATVGLAKAINPFCAATAAVTLDGDSAGDGLIIGIGRAPRAHLRLGADGFIATTGPEARIVDRPASLWGGLLAGCLGATTAFHHATGRGGALPNGRFSLWELGAVDGGDGPADPGPVDVGRVLQVGAGAVGCAVAFALVLVGLRGEWAIVDGDWIDVSNLNRQVLFVAADTDWPMGPAAGKAPTVARRLDAATEATIHHSPRWYGRDQRIVDSAYDLVLALANDGGVRGKLQARQPTVLLHATTSDRWQAQIHRHVAGRDDCIDCRLPPEPGRMRCSTGRVETQGERIDAALPFLSNTAGVLLVGQLARLQHGALLELPANQVVVDLAEPTPWREGITRTCRTGCRVRLPAEVRLTIDAHSRWSSLDIAA
jgi:hypothetical protein